MSPLNRLGQRAARHARLVIAIWLIAAAGAVALAAQSGAKFIDSMSTPGTHSTQANDVLASTFPQFAGTQANVVFRAQRGTVRDASVAAGIEATIALIRSQPSVASVTDPLAAGGGSVSADGTIAYAAVQYSAPAGDLAEPAVDRLQEAGAAARAAGAQVEVNGELVDYAAPLAGSVGEGVGILAALVILLLAFGSIVAAILPIATALFALAGGISAVILLATQAQISTVAPTVAAMLGLGAGIDYALFISSRFREQLRAGHGVVESAGLALATSGRAVLFAGSTVVVSILALWLSGLTFFGWLGTAGAIAVAVTVLAALTLLPAILGLIGIRIERLHVPSLARRASSAGPGSPDGSGWAAWGHRVADRPWPYLLASLGILLALAVPVLSLRVGTADQGSASVTTTQRRAYDLLAQGFGPGFNAPLLVAVQLPASGGTGVLDRIESGVSIDPDVLAVAPPQLNAAGDTAIIAVIPGTSPQAAETQQLLNRLQGDVLPSATSGSGATTHITGVTAVFADLSTRAGETLPIVVGAVIALSFILLLLAFRSIVIAATAAVLNLLSLGAAFGVVVAVFQWGWGLPLVGLDQTVPINPAVPMFLFAVLFGLSMDYEVFLLSRIREAYTAGGDTRSAVIGGIASTARVITSAALIMIAVFLSFVPVEMIEIKMIGVGLATAILVDATLVRVILLPAVMSILGRANWWIPRWLDRLLPHLGVEGPAAVPEG